jgi:hypothetical protein
MMERQRTANGEPRMAPRGGGRRDPEALGDVARDMIDHASIIVRDRIEIMKLEAGRMAERARREFLPRAALLAVAAGLAGVAGLLGLVALFLGIASAIGVAWTFAIYAAAFAVLAVVALAFAGQPPRPEEGEAIARRFPAPVTSAPEHGLVEHGLVRLETEEGHRRVTEEARREASPPL